MNRLLLILSALMVCGATLIGVWVTGGPEHSRMKKRDHQRLFDIEKVADFLKCELPGEPLPASLQAPDFCDGKS